MSLKTKSFGEIFNSWPNDLFETNLYKALESSWQLLMTMLRWTNTSSLISKWDTSSHCLLLLILFSMLPSSFSVSDCLYCFCLS